MTQTKHDGLVTLEWKGPKLLLELYEGWLVQETKSELLEKYWYKPGVYLWIDRHGHLVYVGMARKSGVLTRQVSHYRGFLQGGFYVPGMKEVLGLEYEWPGYKLNRAEKRKSYEERAEVIKDTARFLKVVEYSKRYADAITVYMALYDEAQEAVGLKAVEGALIRRCYMDGQNARLQNEQELGPTLPGDPSFQHVGLDVEEILSRSV